MLVPLPFSFYYADGSHSALILSSIVAIIPGLIGFFLTSKTKQEIRAREGFAIVTFSWITFAAAGSLPFIFSGAMGSFTDAFFETMSGFTTTYATCNEPPE